MIPVEGTRGDQLATQQGNVTGQHTQGDQVLRVKGPC